MPKKLIGPRRKSGAYYKKRPATKKPRVKATKNLNVAIQRVLNRNLETKYVISSFIGLSVTNTCRSKMTPAGGCYI